MRLRSKALTPKQLQSLKSQLSSMNAEIGKLRTEVGANNPRLAGLVAARKSVEAQLRTEMANNRRTVEQQGKNAQGSDRISGKNQGG